MGNHSAILQIAPIRPPCPDLFCNNSNNLQCVRWSGRIGHQEQRADHLFKRRETDECNRQKKRILEQQKGSRVCVDYRR